MTAIRKLTKLSLFVALTLVVMVIVSTQVRVSANEMNNMDTSDWKTYVNENWNYQIQHPSDWYVDEGPEEIVINLVPIGVETKPYIKDTSKRIAIYVYINKEAIQDPYYPPGVEVRTKTINIGGKEAQEDILTELTGKHENRKTKWILVEKNGRYYKLVAGLEDPKTARILGELLDTFKFVE